ncbi:hypothetical protein CDD83_1035 [Cordyceps sp. RAO-2017]|nr:hypothetical protein CDD83_1035 [Cordyceps sp. RAO-2017]
MGGARPADERMAPRVLSRPLPLWQSAGKSSVSGSRMKSAQLIPGSPAGTQGGARPSKAGPNSEPFLSLSLGRIDPWKRTRRAARPESSSGGGSSSNEG